MISHNAVKDLLPSFIDGLCSEDTNEEIREHLDICPECSAVYADMKGEPISKEPLQNQQIQKDVDYLKKIRRRIFWRILIAIAVVLVLVGVFLKIFVIGMRVNSSDVSYTQSIVDNKLQISIDYKGKGELSIRPVYMDVGHIKTMDYEHYNKRTLYINVRAVPAMFGMGNSYTTTVDMGSDIVDNYSVVIRYKDKRTQITRSEDALTSPNLNSNSGSVNASNSGIISHDETNISITLDDPAQFTLFILLFDLLIVACILLTVFSILSIVNDTFEYNAKIAWIVLTVIVTIVGPIIYFCYSHHIHKQDGYRPLKKYIHHSYNRK
jgi:hypothetical protein